MTAKARRTKSELLNAAREILVTDGIGRLSMDRVAERAGVSKGAIMYHFPTKRALQAALIENYAEHLDREFRRCESLFEGSPDEVLIPAYVEWFRGFNADSKGWAGVGVQLLSQQSHDPELLEPIRAWYARLFARIERLPKRSRTRMLLVILSLEGLFYTHKFNFDALTEAHKDEVCALMTEFTGTAAVSRRGDAAAADYAADGGALQTPAAAAAQ